MAAPHVTGAAALALSANPRLTSAQLTNVLTSTATDLGTPNYDTTFGFGLVNAKAAVQKALATP
jgi:subtilisin family serine protease